MAGPRGAPGALFCDTNVLIRLLTDDPPAQARAAERFLDRAAAGHPMIIVTDLVIAETAYVLTGTYGVPIAQAAELIGAILDLPGIEVADEGLLRDSLSIWSGSRLDFADAYLAALARGTQGAGVVSFDADFDRVEGVTRVRP